MKQICKKIYTIVSDILYGVCLLLFIGMSIGGVLAIPVGTIMFIKDIERILAITFMIAGCVFWCYVSIYCCKLCHCHLRPHYQVQPISIPIQIDIVDQNPVVSNSEETKRIPTQDPCVC